MDNFVHKDILSAKQFSKKDLEIVFKKARIMEKIILGEEKSDILKGKIMASLFYEPSTRTRLSFETAMKKLGGEVISVSDGISSSISKGESIEDNARINSIYSDILVIRHPEVGSVERSAKVVNIPVINAGDGSKEHPTQSLLDLYTILKEKKRLNNLNISIVGDLKFGRTVHSLITLMSLFENITFKFISPEELKIPIKIKDFLKNKKIQFEEASDYTYGIKNTDILYVTRIQKERFSDTQKYEELKNKFILNSNLLKSAKKNITIMHPLPRVNEIDKNIDLLPNASFFRQAQNGLPIRMALLYLVLN